jgi:hypothetical protein
MTPSFAILIRQGTLQGHFIYGVCPIRATFSTRIVPTSAVPVWVDAINMRGHCPAGATHKLLVQDIRINERLLW